MKLACAHLAIGHKQAASNRQSLLALLHKAGEQGMNVVLAPELAVSGYSFADYRDMAPYAETADGPTLTAVAHLCTLYGMYACIGLAEMDPLSGILYNSAFVVDPNGSIVCRYRKINAEFRWACPGDPTQDNTFDTPWGRIGVLICSDSYHSLMPRVTALRGANLLLIIANWPPTGLNPVEIWRARAMENGVFVAACNRTGQDLVMDCSRAPSAVISPHGAMLLQKQARTSKLMKVEIFLNGEDRLKSGLRLKRLAARHFDGLHDCYLNLSGLTDLTAFLQLPPPGHLQVHCHCPGVMRTAPEVGATSMTEPDGRVEALHVLVHTEGCDEAQRRELCRRYGSTGQHATVCLATAAGVHLYRISDGQIVAMPSSQVGFSGGNAAVLRFDCGPARVHILPAGALYHPEPVLASAKQGADLVILFSPVFHETVRLLAGARTIEQVALVVCSPEGAGMWMPPEGHQRWEEVLAGADGQCRALLDTTRTRKKRFQDRIDYQTLLRGIPKIDGTSTAVWSALSPSPK